MIGGAYLTRLTRRDHSNIDCIRLSAQAPGTIPLMWDGTDLDGSATISYDTNSTDTTRSDRFVGWFADLVAQPWLQQEYHQIEVIGPPETDLSLSMYQCIPPSSD